jgi:hypothetical protein
VSTLSTLLQDAPAALPGWIGPTVAVSTALIAFVAVVFLVGASMAARALQQGVDAVAQNLGELRRDLAAVLEGARRVTDQGEALVRLVHEEGDAYLTTSRRFRRRLDRGIDRMSERMADLDALYEVVHEEVEDTALRLASALRTARLSTGIIARVLRRRR